MAAATPLVSPHRAACLGLLALGLATAAPARAQGEPAAGAPGDAVARLEESRKALEGDASLGEDAKARVLELITRAIDERRKAAATVAETAALRKRVAGAAERIAQLRARLEQPAPAPRPADHAAVPLDELIARAREKEQTLEAAREELKSRERELAAVTALGPTLSDLVAERRKELRELKDKAGVPVPGELPAATEARKAYLAAREARLGAEIADAELQLANYEVLTRLATLERDAAALEVPRLDAEREALTAAVEARRAKEVRAAREQARETEAEAAGLPEAIASVAAENVALREELETVTLNTGVVAEKLRATERRVSELEADLAALRERVETVGSTEAIGRLLQRRLRSVRLIKTDRRAISARADEIVRATDRRIDLGEQRRELADTRSRVDAMLASVPEAERERAGEAALREQAAALVAAERTTLDELHEAYGRYLTQLTSLEAAERRLAATANAMVEFARRELLWVRTLPPVSLTDLAAMPRVLSGAFDVANWRLAMSDAKATAAARPLLTALGTIAVLAVVGVRPWARRRLGAVGDLTASIHTDAFRHTLWALVLTLLIAAAWPVVLATAGWLLVSGGEPADFSRQASRTLLQLASLLAIFATARWLIHYNGLARRHFRWPERVRVLLRRELRWLTPLSIVCVVFGVYAFMQQTPEASAAVGRPALMIFAAALAVFYYRLFRRRAPLMWLVFRRNPRGVAARTWWFWFPLGVAVPAANVLAAAAGYMSVAFTVTALLIDTGWLLLGVWTLRDVMLRWFTVSERRLRFEQALEQRAEARAERARQRGGGAEPTPTETAEVEVPEVDYRELGDQGRTVVQLAVIVGVILGLARLWSDLLPALDVLDRFQLPMSRVSVVDGVEQRVAVTVTDVVVALLVLAATLIAVRNLSGVLGFTLLHRVARDAGAQYAIVTLCQYALVAAGLLYALAAIGVEWSKLQWLVAALGVGLGFGLQEIVANFVSGIILLLERPIRVGDVVTVGDATGTVARIRIRATTIVDWDRKELVVPNKEFVTGRLLNWTLSNNLLRLIVRVGVAYGADVRRARELLAEVAKENETVLEDPAPIILFNSFGDNALGLELRVYLPSIEHLLRVETELHHAIYDKFDQAGIVIAYPQRDVHLDTSGPLDVRLHNANDVRAHDANDVRTHDANDVRALDGRDADPRDGGGGGARRPARSPWRRRRGRDD